MKKIERYEQSLQEIANFSGDMDFKVAVAMIMGIAKNALNPNRKATLLEYAKKARPQATVPVGSQPKSNVKINLSGVGRNVANT